LSISEPGSNPAAPPEEVADIDVPAHRAVATGPLATAAYIVGGIGLLGATAIDSLAVTGRHAGVHLLGSIELVQAMVVLLSTSAMVIATLVRGHASVHIVTDRLAIPTRDRLGRLAALVSAAVFVLLVAGSIIVAHDLWHGFEETELLRLPIRWLRVIWIVAAAVIAVTFLGQALRRPATGPVGEPKP
jgi:TRAP-type C4-dicarboxylate transport system permease small subunit